MKKFTVVDARIVVETDDSIDDGDVGRKIHQSLIGEWLSTEDHYFNVAEFEYSHIIMETKDEGPKVSIHEELPSDS